MSVFINEQAFGKTVVEGLAANEKFGGLADDARLVLKKILAGEPVSVSGTIGGVAVAVQIRIGELT